VSARSSLHLLNTFHGTPLHHHTIYLNIRTILASEAWQGWPVSVFILESAIWSFANFCRHWSYARSKDHQSNLISNHIISKNICIASRATSLRIWSFSLPDCHTSGPPVGHLGHKLSSSAVITSHRFSSTFTSTTIVLDPEICSAYFLGALGRVCGVSSSI